VRRKIRFLKEGDPRWRIGLSDCARRSSVRFLMRSLRIFTELILPATLWPWSRISLCTRPLLRADKFTTFMCRFSRNLGTSNSWNPPVLSRPVKGSLYHVWRGKTKGKVVPVYALKIYRVVISLIFDFCTRWQWVVNFTLRRFISVQVTRYPLSRKPGGPHCQFGHFSGKKLITSSSTRGFSFWNKFSPVISMCFAIDFFQFNR
jgi:hypothetical protein